MKITDIHIKVSSPSNSVVYQDGTPREVHGGEVEMIKELLVKLEAIKRVDFMVDHDGKFYRGRHDRNAVDSAWFRLRVMEEKAPTLDTLPSVFPSQIKRILMSNSISRGGLVLIVGGPGCGKTTTGSAVIVSRLEHFGGFALTVEEPPELPLNGWHGLGLCSQTWVAGDSGADWDESMRGVLRSQPSGAKLMLYVGEVRDKETARAMLRAAGNGFLVVATSFGSDLVSGVDTFFQLLGQEYASSLAAVLRVVVHQHLDNARQTFKIQVLTSQDANSPVAAMIRAGKVAQLQNEVLHQNNLLQMGKMLLAD